MVAGVWALVVVTPIVAAQEALNSHCSMRGMINASSSKCTCVSGWTGPDCSLRLCAVGFAWADYATDNDKARHGRRGGCGLASCLRRSAGLRLGVIVVGATGTGTRASRLSGAF